jgi:hypothetical protein
MSQPQTIPSDMIAGSILRGVAGAVAAGLVIGFLGPFGTFERMEAGERLVFWTLCMTVGTLVHMPAYWGFAWVAAQRGISAWIWVPASALFAALPMTLMVNGVAAALFGDIALDSFVSLYPLVLAISLPVVCVTHLLNRPGPLPVGQPGGAPATRQAEVLPPPVGPQTPASAAASAPSVAEAPARPLRAIPLMAALPPRLGDQVLCLQMEDHYIRVHTDKGSAMVHHRMADAEASLAPHVQGLRVHRSWWVAQAAITGWRRDGKSLTLSLANGLEVPVARDRQPTVRAAGWLD